MKKIFFMLVIIFSASLFADQAAWITKEQATNAVKLLVTAKTMRHFCEPCGDKFFREKEIVMVDSGPAEPKNPSSEYFEVRINGKLVDLAYLFIQKDNQWLNVAILLDMEVQGVSKVLPETVKAKKN